MRRGRETGPPVLLLAEDDPGDQELLRRALEASGVTHVLKVVEDGEEAIDYLLRRGAYRDPVASPLPDLLVLDLNMPRADGREVLRVVRETPGLRWLPTVVLTTSTQDRDVTASYELGAQSFVTKPARYADFARVVRILAEHWLDITQLPPGGDPNHG
jgi:CheY-like chemotaxis protein